MVSQVGVKNPSSLYGEGDRNQPPRQSMQDHKVPALRDEESPVHPSSKVSQMLSESSNRDMKMVPIREGVPEEARKARRTNSGKEEIHDGISDMVQKLSDLNMVRKDERDEPLSVRVITLAGDNKGATMEFGGESENGKVNIHRGYKLNQEDRNREIFEAGPKGRPPSNGKDTYINNNVQGINNSIMYNSSCANRDPGVNMKMSNNHPVKKKKHEEGKSLYPHGKSPKRRSRFAPRSISEVSRLPPPPPFPPNVPPVKRRCLRALFMESSSESSPERSRPKPRRHGCRYECQGHGKCKDNVPNNQHEEGKKKISSDDKESIEQNKLLCTCLGSSLFSRK